MAGQGHLRRLGGLAAALLVLAAMPAASAAKAADALPPDRLWRWDGDRPPPADRAVAQAVVVTHLLLQDGQVLLRPGQGPARGPGPQVIPVVHVQLSTLRPPATLAPARPAIRDAVLAAASRSRSGWVQLDLEARPSQRADYLDLVRGLHAELPPGMRLSVTALAWWCRSPAWLDTLAADEVVPMFFRMGRDGTPLGRLAREQPDRLHPRCRDGAAGFSLDEPPSPAWSARYSIRYWFDPSRGRTASPLPGMVPPGSGPQ